MRYYLHNLKQIFFVLEIGGLNHPVFTCPIWNITTKHPGTDINSYATNNLTSLLNVYGGYCQDPTQMKPGDLLPPLNPDISNCFRKINPFSQCKNNCRGGSQINIFSISFKLFQSTFLLLLVEQLSSLHQQLLQSLSMLFLLHWDC